MQVRFTKMHGAGNDFVVLDATAQALPPLEAFSQRLCDRHRGVGADQVLVCLLYTSPSPRDKRQSRMPSSA